MRSFRDKPRLFSPFGLCMIRKFPVLLVGFAALAACTSAPQIATGPGSAQFLTPAAMNVETQNYLIGPTDTLSIRVFQVEDLSFDEIHVDAGGMLQLPLIGSVRAAGMTPADLSRDIEMRLGQQYLRNPNVTVTVTKAASQKVTVDGAVTKPGVYEMVGRTTLMQAVAMAEGPTQIADMRQVAVFRNVDGRRMAAVFDLQQIRSGQSIDPVLSGDDVVVVDTSTLQAALRDILQALPGLAVFAYIN